MGRILKLWAHPLQGENIETGIIKQLVNGWLIQAGSKHIRPCAISISELLDIVKFGGAFTQQMIDLQHGFQTY